MDHRDGGLSGGGGCALYYQCWQPRDTPRAVLLVVHGLGEHGGRYRPLAEFFTARGFAVAVLDQRGHGRSGGTPGYVERFADYLDDLGLWHREMAAQYPGIPCFLLGHSLGGLIGALYLLRRPRGLAGCVLSGPLVQVAPDPGPLQRLALRLLAVLAPRLGVQKLDAGGVSRDPQVVADYSGDPLVFHGRLSARLLAGMFAAMAALQRDAAGITLPLLLLHGAADRMTSPEGTRLLHERVSCGDRTLTLYPGLYHEIFNEPERLQVLGDVLAWLEARIPAG